MKCIFCNKAVTGEDGMSVPGKGPAHLHCFKANEVIQRTFMGLDITELTDEDLIVLKDLVLAEENYRNRDSDDIELF